MMENIATLRRVSGLVSLVTGGYSIIGSTGGLGHIFGELVMFVLGGITVFYGTVLLTDRGDSFAGWNGPILLSLALLMMLNQILNYPTGGFADAEMWSDDPGNQAGMYVLIGILSLHALGLVWYETHLLGVAEHDDW